MIRLLGAVLLVGGASAVGFSAAARLRARVRCLLGFVSAVEYMQRELSFRLTPLPVIFAALSGASHAPVNGFFARCSKKLDRLGEKPLRELWREALEEAGLPLEEDETRVLLELGGVVGRYDGGGQHEALMLAHGRLSRFAQRAQEEQNRLEKVYSMLGLSAGAFLLLVLL